MSSIRYKKLSEKSKERNLNSKLQEKKSENVEKEVINKKSIEGNNSALVDTRSKEINVQNVLKSIEKTLKYIAYMKASSFILMKVLNVMTFKKKKKSGYILSAVKKVTEYKEYLMWLESLLEQLHVFVEHHETLKPVLKSQLVLFIDMTKKIRIMLRNTENLLTFVILSKFISGNALGLSSKTLGLRSSFVWIGMIYFLHVQFQSIWPKLEYYTNELITFIKISVIDNWEQLMEDLEESNPDLYEKIQNKVQQLKRWTVLPKFFIQKGIDIYKASERQRLRVQPLALPTLHSIIDKSFEAYVLSKKNIKKFYLADPLSFFLSRHHLGHQLHSISTKIFSI